MRLASRIGDYRIYKLTEEECRTFYKPYPCYVCWEEKPGTINHDIGNLLTTENETDSLAEMELWCNLNT